MTMSPITLSTVRVQSVESSSGGHAPASLAALMPDPQNVDVGLVVAQMTIESSFRSRELARADKKQAQQAMTAAQDAQLEAMRRQAEKNYEAAVAEAIGKIVEGGLGVVGGAMSTGVLGGKSDSTNAAHEQVELQRWQGWGTAASSLGKVGAGVASLYAAGEREDADRAGIVAKKREMEAGAHKHALDNAEDELKEARAHAQKALDFLRELRSTEARSMAAAIRG